MQSAVLMIRNTKFGKTRWVPLGPTLAHALVQYANVKVAFESAAWVSSSSLSTVEVMKCPARPLEPSSQCSPVCWPAAPLWATMRVLRGAAWAGNR
jgi:hypothetical protein